MSDGIIIALISLSSATIVAIITLIGNLIMNKKKTRADEIRDITERQQMRDRDEFFNEKIKSIEKKLDDHNNYAKIFATVDKKVDILSYKVDTMEKNFNSIICYPKKGD